MRLLYIREIEQLQANYLLFAAFFGINIINTASILKYRYQ